MSPRRAPVCWLCDREAVSVITVTAPMPVCAGHGAWLAGVLAATGTGFAVSGEQPDAVVAAGVRDAVSGRMAAAEPDGLAEATGWLTGWLAERGGSAPSRDVTRAAVAAGISSRVLARALEVAGVTRTRTHDGPVIWHLGSTR